MDGFEFENCGNAMLKCDKKIRPSINFYFLATDFWV